MGKTGKRGFAVKLAAVLLVFLLAGIYYYVALPAANIHSSGFWGFLLGILLLLLLLYVLRRRPRSMAEVRSYRGFRIGILVVGLAVVVYIIGSILSSPIVNAKRYHALMEPVEREFTEDIKQISFEQIPILDRDSAILLGEREMGGIVDMVSQYEVSSLYSQINVGGTPVRVSPLVYASPIKWLTNRANGIPAYMQIDMATQSTDLVRLDTGIRYSASDYFNRNIYRHLRFCYPTYMFDQISFEIDDDGVPYWVCPVQKYTIGLFGGQTIGRVVLCNAQTGETFDYAAEDCPTWVDRVYPADLLLQLYNYHGLLGNGYLNSIFGQRGCLQTTEGYNYIAMDDDVWVYTGITSVNSDESNVGFVLINQRTMETRYYAIPGAEEFSAMRSAEGQVQNLGYDAAFPLLLNIGDQPTYVMALKDGAGLVKKYAMVNVQQYQNVAIGDTLSECQTNYGKLLLTSGITAAVTGEEQEASGTISRMAQAVVEGNSHFYLVLGGREEIFDVPVTEFVEIVRYQVGDRITLTYTEGSPVCTVTGISD